MMTYLIRFSQYLKKTRHTFINLKNNFYIVEVTNEKNMLLTLEDKKPKRHL